MNLRKLDLGETQVRDVSPLSGLKKLEELSLNGTPVSDQQVQELQQALPDCMIDYLFGKSEKANVGD